MRKTLRYWMTVRLSRPSLLGVESLDNLSLANAYRSHLRGRSFAKAFARSQRIATEARRIVQEQCSQDLGHHPTRTRSLWFHREPHRAFNEHCVVETSAPSFCNHRFYRT